MENTNNSYENAFSREIIEILSELHSADLAMIGNAVNKLKSIKETNVGKEILNALYNSDPTIRSEAIELLLLLDPEQYIERLLLLLEDPVNFVRSNLLDYLIDSTVNNPQIVKAVINVLLNDPDSDVRALATVILRDKGGSSAIPALQWAYEHDFGKDYEGVSVSYLAKKALDKINNRNMG
jgi:HEAT repeat protein